MPRKPGPVEDRRAQILNAALKLFAEKGFQGASNKEIAKAAGNISPGLIYFYFKNKEDLLFALLENRLTAGDNPLPVDSLTMFPPEQVLPMIAHFALSRLDNQDMVNVIKVLAGEVIQRAEVRAITNSNMNRILETIGSYLASQMAQGRLRQDDPILCAQTFLAGLVATIMRRQLLGDPKMLAFTTDQIVTTVVGIFLRGMRPE
jgi:AcrR family transcriptional regulator